MSTRTDDLIAWARASEPAEFTDWMRNRLHGRDLRFSLRDDVETRGELVAFAIAAVRDDAGLTDRFRGAIETLLREVTADAEVDTRYARSLFYLVEIADLDVAIDCVVDVLDGPLPAAWQTAGLDLAALTALARMHRLPRADYWTPLARDPRTATIAVAAVARQVGSLAAFAVADTARSALVATGDRKMVHLLDDLLRRLPHEVDPAKVRRVAQAEDKPREVAANEVWASMIRTLRGRWSALFAQWFDRDVEIAT